MCAPILIRRLDEVRHRYWFQFPPITRSWNGVGKWHSCPEGHSQSQSPAPFNYLNSVSSLIIQFVVLSIIFSCCWFKVGSNFWHTRAPAHFDLMLIDLFCVRVVKGRYQLRRHWCLHSVAMALVVQISRLLEVICLETVLWWIQFYLSNRSVVVFRFPCDQIVIWS